jgi:hypothetical protein
MDADGGLTGGAWFVLRLCRKTPTIFQHIRISEEQNKELRCHVCDWFDCASSVSFPFHGLCCGTSSFAHAISTCPSRLSFDFKKEFKVVLRGHDLAEWHPDKPRGFFEGLAARVVASVATELMTQQGYEVYMLSLAGAAIFTTVTIPTAKFDCYWVGAYDEWHYVRCSNSRYE